MYSFYSYPPALATSTTSDDPATSCTAATSSAATTTNNHNDVCTAATSSAATTTNNPVASRHIQRCVSASYPPFGSFPDPTTRLECHTVVPLMHTAPLIQPPQPPVSEKKEVKRKGNEGRVETLANSATKTYRPLLVVRKSQSHAPHAFAHSPWVHTAGIKRLDLVKRIFVPLHATPMSSPSTATSRTSSWQICARMSRGSRSSYSRVHGRGHNTDRDDSSARWSAPDFRLLKEARTICFFKDRQS